MILTKRLQIFGSVLPSRTLEDKIEITQRFKHNWLPLLRAGKIKPIILAIFSKMMLLLVLDQPEQEKHTLLWHVQLKR